MIRRWQFLVLAGVAVLLLAVAVILYILIESSRESASSPVELVSSDVPDVTTESNEVSGNEFIQSDTTSTESVSNELSEVRGSEQSIAQLQFELVVADTDTVDIFIVSGRTLVAGRDSRSGSITTSSFATYEEPRELHASGSTMFVTTADIPFKQNIEIHFLGTAPSNYTFSGSYDSATGSKQFYFSGTLDEAQMRVYTFQPKTGVIDISERDYSEILQPVSLVDSSEHVESCEDPALEEQLFSIMQANNFTPEDLAKADVNFTAREIDLLYGMTADSFSTPGPVCVVELRLHEPVPDLTVDTGWRVINEVNDTSSLVIGTKHFGSQPADSPLSSSNQVPIMSGDRSVQFLETSFEQHLININFPGYWVCPCAIEYTASLTAPLRVVD